MRINNQTKALDAHYQKEVKAKEERLKEVKDIYNKKIQEIKETGDDKIVENRNLERERIAQELEQEKDKWEELRNKWKEKEAYLESNREKKELEHEHEINAARVKYGKLLELEGKNFGDNLKSLETRENKALSDLKQDTTSKLYQEQIKSRHKIDSLQKENERMEDLAIRSYSDFNSVQRKEIDKAVAEKEKEHRLILKKTNEENSKQLKEWERINRDNQNRIIELNQDKVEASEKNFQTRMERIQKENEENLRNYSLRGQNEINKLKMSESKDKDLIRTRSDDNFYSITNLNPKITNKEKEYILTISLPEHEKDSIVLGADGRSLKISQTRRFSDEFKDPDGTLNKSARSEVISKVIKLEDLVNPRQITQSFEDDKLTFKIPKA